MLNMVSVGEYLGEHHELNINVLKKLVGLHKLEGLSLVDALRYSLTDYSYVSFDDCREFLSSFHLPGEGQKIDRIMEHFAQGYCTSNPTIFSNPGTLLYVCVSICV